MRTHRYLLPVLALVLSAVVATPALADQAGPGVQADDGSHVVAENTVGGDPRTLDLTVRSTGVGGYAMVRLILPSGFAAEPDRTWPAVYLLAGETRRQDYLGWSANTDIRRLADRAGVLVVMPGTGPAGFFTDWWNYGKDLDLNQWETFTAVELPQLVDRGYRGDGRRAGAGLSLGGYGAFELAARRPGVFRYAASYSGNLYPTGPTGELLTDAIVASARLDPGALWGDRRAQSSLWEAHDPLVNAERLRGTELYLSAGNGLPGPLDGKLPIDVLPGAMLLEFLCGGQSTAMADRLRRLGVPVTTDLYGPGTHQWAYWQEQLHKTWPRMLQVLGAGAGS
ncbi:alpha/beta hydrolase family protein [Amycolatopsis sp. PS_44_ISF1]|uniref:alpha/beta hydrolase n=1 Tax=Amycolatopsis sp. PS_44_ISF1 TaxID=2974917 RepID=UPI0028DFF3F9|nr:alpha/beta hydrolase family protein [Amycolatopsis sp. PS_44_ISF1]MDT8915448.1 esterase family protein [Amycolatopsis sp. PS_44_ISF1]